MVGQKKDCGIPVISEKFQKWLDAAGDDDVIDIGAPILIQVVEAQYLSEYKISIKFSDETQQIVDFEPFLFERLPAGYSKYKKFLHFKKFKIEKGNLVWGKDWDMIFSVEQLHAGKID